MQNTVGSCGKVRVFVLSLFYRALAVRSTLEILLVYLGFTLIIFTLGMCSTKYFKDDNAYEEVAEELIEGQTGVQIDLSPNSPE